MQLLTDKLIQALSWTLVHSLWQGLLLAIIAGIIITLTRKQAVLTRYNLLVGVLFAFIVCTGFSFYYILQSLSPIQTIGTNSNTGISGIDFVATPTLLSGIEDAGVIKKSITFLNSNAGIIVLVWLMILLVKFIQLLGGFRNLYILKTRGLSSAGDYWNNRLKELANKIQLQKPVQLVQSAIARVPMVAGYIKPVILIPAGLLTSIPNDEIEAILLHELAHIRRKDYLVNMLQQFCEMLFFFNPAVLWISYLIKEERENCCDDIAIRHVKNKKQFIQALINFQEYNLSNSSYTLAFPGSRNQLLNRARRILTNNNKTLNTMEKSILTSCLLLTGFVVVAFTQKQDLPAKQQPVAENSVAMQNPPAPFDNVITEFLPTPAADTTPAKKSKTVNEKDQTIISSRNGKEYKMVLKKDKVLEFYEEGKKIPQDQYSQYKETMDSLLKEMEQWRHAAELAEESRKKAEVSRQRMEEIREKAIALQKQSIESNREYEKAVREIAEAQKQIEKEQRQHVLESKRIYEKMLRELELSSKNKEDNEKYREKLIESQKVYKEILQSQSAHETRKRLVESQEEDRKMLFEKKAKQREVLKELEREMMHSKMEQKAALREAERSLKLAEVERRRAAEHRERGGKLKELIINITEDLNQDGIITNKEELSFNLENDSFTVNGVKQPDAVQKKYREKYLGSNNDYIRHTRKNGSTNTSININK